MQKLFVIISAILACSVWDLNFLLVLQRPGVVMGILVSYRINSQNTHFMQKLFVIISAQLYVVFEIFLFC